jgi:hypothetical protein
VHYSSQPLAFEIESHLKNCFGLSAGSGKNKLVALNQEKVLPRLPFLSDKLTLLASSKQSDQIGR